MQCLQNAWYKFCKITSFIRKFGNIIFLNNILSKFIMLTHNNPIFRNCFVIIHYHLTKVSSRINKCIISEDNELSITLSTLWYDLFIHYTASIYSIQPWYTVHSLRIQYTASMHDTQPPYSVHSLRIQYTASVYHNEITQVYNRP